jgi:hypothetical protein
LTHENKFVFSKKENVVLLILDSFQSDLFQEILREDPGLADAFDGFSYYRNTIASYPFTEASTFNILTGEYFDFSQPFQQQIKDIYLRGSILKELKEAGYSVDVFPLVSYGIYFDETLISNLQPKRLFNLANEIFSCWEVYRISVFNLLPHFCKRPYYQILVKTTRESQISRAMEFQNASIGFQDQRKTFKFYHFPIPHEPFVVNEN